MPLFDHAWIRGSSDQVNEVQPLSKYERALRADHFIVAVHGTAADVDRARSILQRTGAIETAVHAATRSL
jgi:hypothetical protein